MAAAQPTIPQCQHYDFFNFIRMHDLLCILSCSQHENLGRNLQPVSCISSSSCRPCSCGTTGALRNKTARMSTCFLTLLDPSRRATSSHSVFYFLPSAQTMQYPNQTSCHRWSAGRGQPCRSRKTPRRARRLQIPVLVSDRRH